jgi:hypothetical protein
LLNRHVERLFWQYGLFPWKNDDGQIQVKVPLATDAPLLIGLRPRLRLMTIRLLGRFMRFMDRVSGPLRRQVR